MIICNAIKSPSKNGCNKLLNLDNKRGMRRNFEKVKLSTINIITYKKALTQETTCAVLKSDGLIKRVHALIDTLLF